MGYWNELGFLERGVNAGAIEGSDALSALMELDARRRENMQARREAARAPDAGALDSLMKNSFAAAGEPVTAQDAMRLTAAESAFPTNPEGALDSLFLPQDSKYLGNQGQSRIDPSIRPEDIAIIRELAASQTPRIEIMDALSQTYGPKTLSRLLPELDDLMDDLGVM